MQMSMSKQNPLVRFNQVTITRQDQCVLRDVDWKVFPGEHHFILGNNGSGKTTLIELLMGFLWPDEGTIHVLGQKYGEVDLREVRKNFGQLSPWLLERIRPHFLVREVIASGMEGLIGKPGKISGKTRGRMQQLLRFFELENYAERTYGTLSSGEQMRVILARALVHQPRLLVLDEPFAHLDVHARLKMYVYLERLVKQQGRRLSIILITHHLRDILPFFTHGILLHGNQAQILPKAKALTRANLAKTYSVKPEFLRYLESVPKK